MATRKTLPVKTATPARVRRDRRKTAKKMTPKQRQMAAQTLPKSRNQVAAEIGVLRRRVIEAKQRPDTPANRRALNEALKALAAATATAKQQRVRRAKRQSGKVVLSSEQARARKAAMLAKLDAIRREQAVRPGVVPRPTPKGAKAKQREEKARLEKEKAIREGNASKAAKEAKKEVKAREEAKKEEAKKDNSVRKPLDTRAAALAKEEEVIRDRLILLDRGQDIKKPPKVAADKTPIPRPRLPLPAQTVPPADAETVLISRILAKSMPRLRDETVEQYEMRLREMTKRVLARLADFSMKTESREQAIEEAIRQTLEADTHIIQKEVESTGAVAVDEAADMMDPYVDKVAADINAAATEVAPPIPAANPTPEEAAVIEKEAEKEQILAAAAPREQSDEIAEDILLAEEPVPLEASDIFRPRNLLIGGAVVVGGFFLYRSLA